MVRYWSSRIKPKEWNIGFRILHLELLHSRYVSLDHGWQSQDVLFAPNIESHQQAPLHTFKILLMIPSPSQTWTHPLSSSHFGFCSNTLFSPPLQEKQLTSAEALQHSRTDSSLLPNFAKKKVSIQELKDRKRQERLAISEHGGSQKISISSKLSEKGHSKKNKRSLKGSENAKCRQQGLDCELGAVTERQEGILNPEGKGIRNKFMRLPRDEWKNVQSNPIASTTTRLQILPLPVQSIMIKRTIAMHPAIQKTASSNRSIHFQYPYLKKNSLHCPKRKESPPQFTPTQKSKVHFKEAESVDRLQELAQHPDQLTSSGMLNSRFPEGFRNTQSVGSNDCESNSEVSFVVGHFDIELRKTGSVTQRGYINIWSEGKQTERRSTGVGSALGDI